MKLWLFLLITSHLSNAQEVDLSIIATIESNNNPSAWNKSDGGSRGLYQISPIGLRDYNKINGTSYTIKDLFNAAINTKIAKWHLNYRIPYLLQHYGIAITIDNKLIAYNSGINYLVNKKEIPAGTKKYLKKYKELSK